MFQLKLPKNRFQIPNVVFTPVRLLIRLQLVGLYDDAVKTIEDGHSTECITHAGH